MDTLADRVSTNLNDVVYDAVGCEPPEDTAREQSRQKTAHTCNNTTTAVVTEHQHRQEPPETAHNLFLQMLAACRSSEANRVMPDAVVCANKHMHVCKHMQHTERFVQRCPSVKSWRTHNLKTWQCVDSERFQFFCDWNSDLIKKHQPHESEKRAKAESNHMHRHMEKQLHSLHRETESQPLEQASLYLKLSHEQATFNELCTLLFEVSELETLEMQEEMAFRALDTRYKQYK